MKSIFLRIGILLGFSNLLAANVTCRFKGQLGNQMFEIAAATAYALDHSCEASFPTLFDAIAGEENYRSIFHRINVAPFPEGTEFYLHEHDKMTNSHIFTPIPAFPNQNVMIDGHCVSEKYFAHHRKAICALFAPTEEIKQNVYAKYGHLLQEKTVAVHVRTFIPDHFLTVCHTPFELQWAKWHYYHQAMAQFPPDYHFLVFSDDIEWTRQHFPKMARKVTFIEGNPPYFDLYFISFCDHQIVSPDSTFSWWGAWLNPNPNKIVICPDSWWDLKTHDALPCEWIKIRRFPR